MCMNSDLGGFFTKQEVNSLNRVISGSADNSIQEQQQHPTPTASASPALFASPSKNSLPSPCPISPKKRNTTLHTNSPIKNVSSRFDEKNRHFATPPPRSSRQLCYPANPPPCLKRRLPRRLLLSGEIMDAIPPFPELSSETPNITGMFEEDSASDENKEKRRISSTPFSRKLRPRFVEAAENAVPHNDGDFLLHSSPTIYAIEVEHDMEMPSSLQENDENEALPLPRRTSLSPPQALIETRMELLSCDSRPPAPLGNFLSSSHQLAILRPKPLRPFSFSTSVIEHRPR